MSPCVCVQVLEDSRAVLIAANMQPDDLFPLDDKIKEGERDWLYHRSFQTSESVCVCAQHYGSTILPHAES